MTLSQTTVHDGKRYGRLIVLDTFHTTKSARVRCDCGKEFVTVRKNLTSGGSRSCGCARLENASITARARKANRRGPLAGLQKFILEDM